MMSLQALWELQERLHTGAIAGINVIQEDFRLKKAIEQFEGLGKASPVFGKIYETIKPLVDPACEDKTGVLLDAITLVDAVVCTQASYQRKGETFSPVELAQKSGRGNSDGKYSQLAPLREALTSKGSGRHSLVQSAYEERLPALFDFRLKADLIHALGDSYNEMADLATTILSEEGEALAPLLRYQFDPMGGGGQAASSFPKGKEMARRVLVLERTSGARENEFYRQLVEQPSCPPVREAAIRALIHSESNGELLMHLAETEKGNLKKAALYTLGVLDLPEAEAFWLKKLEKGSGEEYLRYNPNANLSNALARKLKAALEELPEASSITTELPLDTKIVARLMALFLAVANKDTQEMEEALELTVSRRSDLNKVRDVTGGKSLGAHSAWGGFYNHDSYGNRIGTELIDKLNMVLISGMVLDPRPSLLKMCKELYSRCGTAYLSAGVAAGMLAHETKLFEQYGGVFGSRKEEAQAIYRVFCRLVVRGDGYTLRVNLNHDPGQSAWTERLVFQKLDPRWLEVMTERQGWLKKDCLIPVHEMLAGLICPEDQPALAVIRNYFLYRAKIGQANMADLSALARCGQQDFRGLIPKCVSHQSIEPWSVRYAYQKFPFSLTPAEMADELEEICRVIPKGLNKRRYEGYIREIQGLIDGLRTGRTIQEL